MINLDSQNFLLQTPFTANISYDHLLKYTEIDNPPFPDPHFPIHIQGTERFVQLLTCASVEVLKGIAVVLLQSWLDFKNK